MSGNVLWMSSTRNALILMGKYSYVRDFGREKTETWLNRCKITHFFGTCMNHHSHMPQANAIYRRRCTFISGDMAWGNDFLNHFEFFESQVSGCYDTAVQLYRWAEMTYEDWEHCHKKTYPKASPDALMESALWMSGVVCVFAILLDLNAIAIPQVCSVSSFNWNIFFFLVVSNANLVVMMGYKRNISNHIFCIMFDDL